MPYFGSSASDAFQSGINHVVLNTHENTNSIVLGGALQRDSNNWDDAVQQVASDPHSVLAPFAFSRNASSNASDGRNFVQGYGVTGDGNAESAGTFNQNLSLRMAGDSAAELD